MRLELPPLALVPLLAACATAPPPSPLEGALRGLEARPAWLFGAERCPADVMPPAEAAFRPLERLCETDLPTCLERCQGSEASACYWAALRVQALHRDEAASEALFLRACALGVVSGCTNRAAGMTKNGTEGAAATRCAVRTFERTCHANDPWGCTMFGFHLMKGLGIDRDPDRAARILELACVRFGEEDPACARARELMEELGQAKRGLNI